jgi:glycine cleavage system H protein
MLELNGSTEAQKDTNMTIIFALVSAAAIIMYSAIRKGKPAKVVEQVMIRRYLHRGHAWVRETGDGQVSVGIDEFAGAVIGTIDNVTLPRLLKFVRQGDVAFTVRHAGRVVPIISPVTGWVVEKNEMVKHLPSLVNEAPYGDGWLMRVQPVKLGAQLNNLMTGKSVQQWQDMVKAQLARFFSGTPALMYQDGGAMLTNLADRCSDTEWNTLVQEFFLVNKV